MLKRTKASDDGSQKYLAFGKIKTLALLEEQYKPSKIKIEPVTSFAEPRNLMSIDAFEVITNRLAPELAYSSTFVALDNEKSRYFMIYEIIKTISRLGNRLTMTLVDTGSVTEELTGQRLDTEVAAEERVSICANTSKFTYCILIILSVIFLFQTLSPSELYFRHENIFKDDTGPGGNVEFVLFEGRNDSSQSLIRTVIEVKDYVQVTYKHPDSAHCQLFAELTASYKHNLKVKPDYCGTVYGALTDGFCWMFARINRSMLNGEESFNIQYSECSRSFMLRDGDHFWKAPTAYSLECLQHIVYMLHSDLLADQCSPATAEQVQGLFRECDAGVKDNADQYVKIFFNDARLAIKLKAERDRADQAEAEVKRLKAELEKVTAK